MASVSKTHKSSKLLQCIQSIELEEEQQYILERVGIVGFKYIPDIVEIGFRRIGIFPLVF